MLRRDLASQPSANSDSVEGLLQSLNGLCREILPRSADGRFLETSLTHLKRPKWKRIVAIQNCRFDFEQKSDRTEKWTSVMT